MDALTYNASSLSVRIFEAHYEGLIDAIKP
jgi:hypothetical protein